jgi:hypothetical protein
VLDRLLEQFGFVTDDGDVAADKTKTGQLAGQERAVLIGQLAAHELAAGHHNGGLGPIRERRLPLHGSDATRKGTGTREE